jgi:hypothetical protein
LTGNNIETTMSNNQPPQHQPLLFEALEYRDLAGMMKPTIHVDEFASKMGDDEDIIVVSFFVRSEQVARDLVNWFEKGYDWVLDADRSPGEISPGRFLVYVEMRRRSTAGDKINTMLDDLSTLTEYKVQDWIMTYRDQSQPWSVEQFERSVPRSPAEYRERREQGLNEMRVQAGIDPKPIYQLTQETRRLQSAAGI